VVKTSDYIGLAGSGADEEIEFVTHGIDGGPVETDKAWRLRYDGHEFWMPKSAFSDDGMLYLWAVPMFEEKVGKGEAE